MEYIYGDIVILEKSYFEILRKVLYKILMELGYEICFYLL